MEFQVLRGMKSAMPMQNYGSFCKFDFWRITLGHKYENGDRGYFRLRGLRMVKWKTELEELIDRVENARLKVRNIKIDSEKTHGDHGSWHNE
jgi:hypothetical protein